MVAYMRTIMHCVCFFCILLVFLSSSCSQPVSESDSVLTFQSVVASDYSTIRLVSWNTQTFFDTEVSGSEYSEYLGSKSKWNETLYISRLNRLTKSIIALDADVIALEEIENEAIIQDIVNRMYAACPQKKRYEYACFAKASDAAIGCAVLSRIPLENLSVHQTTVWGKEVPSMRPMLEVSVAPCIKAKKNNTNSATSMTLFVCHWKSKSGDSEETGSNTESAYWRKKQEQVLTARISSVLSFKTTEVIVACGDFNQDISEFSSSSSKKSVLLNWYDKGELKSLSVMNPWLVSPQEVGSYFYRGEWDRIDHFLIAGQGDYENFCVENVGEWVTSDGKPYEFVLYSGEGYSDHFPISVSIKVKS